MCSCNKTHLDYNIKSSLECFTCSDLLSHAEIVFYFLLEV